MTQQIQAKNLDSAGEPDAPAKIQLLQAAWRRKPLILVFMVLGVILAGLYQAKAPRSYESKAQVLVVKKRPDTVTGVDTRNLSIEDYVATHQILIKSPRIIGQAIKKHGLDSLAIFANEKDDLTEVIGKVLTVSRNKGTTGNNNVLNVSYRSTSAEESALIVSSVIESYKDYLDETYRNMSDDTLEQITKARDLLDTQLAQKKLDYREFRLKAPVLGKGKDGNNIWQDRLIGIETKRSALLLRRVEVQGHLEAIDKARKENLRPEVLQMLVSEQTNRLNHDTVRPVSATVQDQLLPLLQEEQKLLEAYGIKHPQVQSVRKRIEIARDLFASPAAAWRKPSSDGDPNPVRPAAMDLSAQTRVETHIEYLRHELENLKSSEQLLAELFEKENAEARKVTGYDLMDADFRSDIVKMDQLYVTIIGRLQNVSLVKDVGGYKADVIASPALGKLVWPLEIVVFPLGAFVGALLGLSLALLMEVSDKSFRTAEDIRRGLGLPVVGCIPQLKPDGEAIRQATESGQRLDPILCVHYRPRSMQAEAYRGVRTALYFSVQGKSHRVFQVTSPNVGDGKSTTAANLAISIAQSGKKVLLIDADMRRPQIHMVFGLSGKLGLASVVSGTGELQDAIKDCCVPGLSLLPSGTPPANPSELLTSPRFAELLALVREQYDFVIVDTPPLLAVTDPSVVAARVDGVILTIRITKDGRPAAERCKEILATLGASVVGVVVNGTNKTTRGEAYGYGSYGYGDVQESGVRSQESVLP